MYLLMGGRITLQKSALASLSVYFLSLFQILVSIKEEIDKIQMRFLWGDTSSTKKIHWVKWNSMCSYLKYRGLEIVDISLKIKQC